VATCPSCASEVPEGNRFCGSCGVAIETPTSAPTETSLKSQPRAGSHPTADQARFIPGTILAKRYRIVGLLGRGGMGEVYRADDLKLGQPVALKFLPAAVQRDPARLDRFLNEVKTALKVTHPNVCRVHDIGEVDGQHYLSMEYVDGEDLASLLRRIERLPQNKAVQIARQLCAGVAAAHEQGILHRDLKPANVMIDGRGRAKITDFGLASLVEGIGGDEVRAGTPQYMSPEQHAGKEVTVRSDIYSLGLVLYELFTGKRAFEAASPAEIRKLQEESSPTAPSSHVEGLDQAVERIILRCLEKDPSQRPASALAVAASLPGGDPLAAALAAGETPTPAMVADAGGVGGLKPAAAIACAAIIIAAMALTMMLKPWFPEYDELAGYVPMEKRPEVLAQDCREILQSLGHDLHALDHAYGFAVNLPYLEHIAETDRSPLRWDRLTSNRPPAVRFWYRQSPRYLVPQRWYNDVISEVDPEIGFSGEALIRVDPEGRLRWLEVIPPEMDESEQLASEPDWKILFDAAGLDMSAFEPVPPVWVPYMYCDVRAAWSGHYPEDPNTAVRIEAGSYRGRPVFFRFVDGHAKPLRMEGFGPEVAQQIYVSSIFVFFTALLAGVVLLARRNLRLGRGDRKGATRLALLVGVGTLLEWLLWADHVPEPRSEFMFLTMALGLCALIGCFVWLAHIALEPFLRKRWPDTLASWNRLLMGRLRDPRIGRDILVGITAFWALWFLDFLILLAPQWFEYASQTPHWSGAMRILLGGRFVAAAVVGYVIRAVVFTMALLFIVLFLRVILRKQWLAFVAFMLILGSTLLGIDPPALYVMLAVQLISFSILFLLLSRFGLLSVLSYFVTLYLWQNASFSPDWHRATAAVFVLVILGLTAYAFYISLAGRPILREGVIPEVEDS
jgi:serine/threonine-protein kinase